MTTKTEVQLSDSVRAMIDAWREFELNEGGHLEGDRLAFVQQKHDSDAELPKELPSIAHGDTIYFAVPGPGLEELLSFQFR